MNTIWEKLRIFFNIYSLMIIWSSNFKFWVPRSITTYFYLIIHCSRFSSSSSRFGMRSDHGLSFDPWMKGWNPFKNPMSFFSLAIFSSSTCTLLWGFSTSFCPFLYIFFEILKREKIIKNENKTCKDMYMICYTIYTHRHMRQEDNGPNLFTLLKEDIFKDDLHLEGVLMEYCTCNSFQRKCSPV